jgi:hypothetical protein
VRDAQARGDFIATLFVLGWRQSVSLIRAEPIAPTRPLPLEGEF